MASFNGIRIPAYWDIARNGDAYLETKLDWDKAQIMRLPDFREVFGVSAWANPKTKRIRRGNVSYGAFISGEWKFVMIDEFTSAKALREWLTGKTQPIDNALAEEISAARWLFQRMYL